MKIRAICLMKNESDVIGQKLNICTAGRHRALGHCTARHAKATYEIAGGS